MEDEIKPCTEKHFKFQVGVGFGFVLANWQLLIRADTVNRILVEMQT